MFVEQMSLSDKLGLSTAEIAQYEAPENVKVSWQKFQEDKQKESDSLSNKIKLYSIEHIHDQKIIYLQLVNGSSIKAKSSLSGLSDDIRQVTGGELSSIGSLIELARKGAISKMKSEAAKLGANAVFGVRISSSALDTKTAEASAYGTAAIIE